MTRRIGKEEVGVYLGRGTKPIYSFVENQLK